MHGQHPSTTLIANELNSNLNPSIYMHLSDDSSISHMHVYMYVCMFPFYAPSYAPSYAAIFSHFGKGPKGEECDVVRYWESGVWCWST